MSQENVIRVRDVMKTNFDIVDGKMTVKEALYKMKHIDTKSLIVEKRNDNDEYGMVFCRILQKTCSQKTDRQNA